MSRLPFRMAAIAMALAVTSTSACTAPVVSSPGGASAGGTSAGSAAGAPVSGGATVLAEGKVGASIGDSTPVDLEMPDATYGADPRDVGPATALGGSMGDAVHSELLPEEPAPPPLPADEPAFRSRRRLDLDQLDASLQRVTGFGWTETRGGREVNLLVELAASLGKPDYAQRTLEDLEPNVTFAKFLDDAARNVCDKVVAANGGRGVLLIDAQPSDTVASAPVRVDANLRALLLRFHGHAVGPGGPALERWRWLFETSTRVGGSPREGWRAVCIALLEHPDFYSY
jgi:hypothetical protein